MTASADARDGSLLDFRSPLDSGQGGQGRPGDPNGQGNPNERSSQHRAAGRSGSSDGRA